MKRIVGIKILPVSAAIWSVLMTVAVLTTTRHLVWVAAIVLAVGITADLNGISKIYWGGRKHVDQEPRR